MKTPFVRGDGCIARNPGGFECVSVSRRDDGIRLKVRKGAKLVKLRLAPADVAALVALLVERGAQ